MRLNNYTFVMTGANLKEVDKMFTNRAQANEEMYRLIREHDLKVVKVYNDKHDKTYICSNGAEFHINRL